MWVKATVARMGQVSVEARGSERVAGLESQMEEPKAVVWERGLDRVMVHD